MSGACTAVAAGMSGARTAVMHGRRDGRCLLAVAAAGPHARRAPADPVGSRQRWRGRCRSIGDAWLHDLGNGCVWGSRPGWRTKNGRVIDG